MSDLSTPLNPSYKRISLHFFLWALAIPLLIYYKNVSGLGYSLKGLFGSTAVNLGIYFSLFFIFLSFFRKKDVAYVLTLSLSLLLFHSSVTLDQFVNYFIIDTAYLMNVIFFFCCVALLTYLVTKFITLRNFIHLACTSCIYVYVAFPIILTAIKFSYIYSYATGSVAKVEYEFEHKAVKEIDANELPDIYYVIADMYPSFDFLEKEIGFDNKEFYQDLKDRGFYIKKESYGNYAQTNITVAGLLQMNYIQDFINDSEEDLKDSTLGIQFLNRLHENNPVFHEMKNMGYEIFETGVFGINITKHRMSKGEEIEGFKIESTKGFIKATLGSTYLSSIYYVLFGPFHDLSSFTGYKRGILKAFENMNEAAETKIEKPKFVFAHSLAPHNPFIFNEDGSTRKPTGLYDMNCCFPLRKMVINGEEVYARINTEAMIGQIKFVNKKLIEFIDKVQNNATRPYVIVMQGDHGSASRLDWREPTDDGLKERISILDVVYTSDGNYEPFKEHSSHVNIFRNIFNEYLGYDMPMLDYKAYYSPYGAERVEFEDITYLTKGKEDIDTENEGGD
jgi:hypothetical protein